MNRAQVVAVAANLDLGLAPICWTEGV